MAVAESERALYDSPMKPGTLFLILCFLTATGWAESPATLAIPEFKAYKLGFADGPNTVETITNVVGQEVKIIYDQATRQLLVIATSNQHAMVSRLVKQLNIPPKNVRVIVQFRNRARSRDTGASVSGKGRFTLDGRDTPTSMTVRPRVEDQRTEVDSATRQQLLVTSGKQASLFIGENVPYLEWLMDYGWRQQIIAQHIEWQRVGAYLLVEPTIIGDGPTIRVRLTPELSGRVNGNPYRTKFTTVSTEVTATDGIPFSLGGLAEKNEFYSHFLIGAQRGHEHQTLDIEMTANILTAGNQ